MPVYNASCFLHDSVGDILSQTYKNFELICVNDGSLDDSGVILDDFATKDNRIKVIHQVNRGGGAARNKGMQYATGKYLLFLDADDRFEPELIEISVKKAEEEDAVVVVYDADAFDYVTGAKRKAQWLIYDEELHSENPFESVNNSVWNKLFLRENIEKYGIEFTERKAAYSTSFVVCAMLVADRICILKDVLLHYRMNNPNSNVSNEDKDPTAIVDSLLNVREFLQKNEIYTEKLSQFLYLCEKEILIRLSFMKTFEGYRRLYCYAHEKCREITSSSDVDYISQIIEEKGLYKLKNICTNDLDEFFYEELEELKKRQVVEKQIFFLPDMNISRKSRIVIYGAGNVGRDFFIQLLRREDTEIVAWVDRNYEKIGFPVQSPDFILKIDYDLVVIAISDNRTACGIKRVLLDMGIQEEKIFYKRPETL